MAPKYASNKRITRNDLDEIMALLGDVDFDNEELLRYLHVDEAVARKYRGMGHYNVHDFWKDVCDADAGNNYVKSECLDIIDYHMKNVLAKWGNVSRNKIIFWTMARPANAMIKNVPLYALNLMRTENYDAYVNLITLLNQIDQNYINYRCTTKTEHIIKYVGKLIHALEESGSHVAGTSDLSGLMYRQLVELNDDMKARGVVDYARVENLADIANSYLGHRRNDKYNKSEYGKIYAADGILNLADYCGNKNKRVNVKAYAKKYQSAG